MTISYSHEKPLGFMFYCHPKIIQNKKWSPISFDNLQDLINIIKFQQDIVVDTTLDGEKCIIIFNSHMKLFFPFI